MPEDTIFALASGRGRAGIAVVRLSGVAAGGAYRRLTGRECLPAPRRAVRAALLDPGTNERLDEGLSLWFPAPASFTGEDVLELHLHGGLAVVNGVLDALLRLPGLRPAEAGEFSRRAFYNGKMDLTALEGLADLVAAETAAQRRLALRQMDGALRELYEGWRERLLRALALAEADIDFVDEEDVPEELAETALAAVPALCREIEAHLADDRRGERLREGIRVVILGPPNAGKSSLLNALARREAAIVSHRAGTTRDVLEVHLDLAGYPVTLVDTAGLRESADDIEAEGVRRALAMAESADLRLLLLDAAAGAPQWAQFGEQLQGARLLVANKTDLAPVAALGETHCGETVLPLSVRTGAGMDALLERLAGEVARLFEGLGEAAPLTRARHRAALQETAAHLARSQEKRELVLRVEDLRLATRSLGRITGRVDVEDLLDAIFGQFCIGK